MSRSTTQATHGVRPLLRSFLRPILRPFLVRIENRIELRLGPLEARVASLEAAVVARLDAVDTRGARDELRLDRLEANLGATDSRLDAHEESWRTHLPAFLNAVSSVAAFGRELQRVASAVRPPAAPGHDRPAQDPAVIDAVSEPATRCLASIEKLAGSSRIRLEPLAAAQPADIRNCQGQQNSSAVTDPANLRVEPESLDEIVVVRLLELFPDATLRERLLPYWRSLLRPNGCLRVIAADGAAMVREAASGPDGFDRLRDLIFSAGTGGNQPQRNLFTPGSLSELLRAAGFADLTTAARPPGGKALEFEIAGHRPPA